MVDASQIKEHMEVVGADGVHVGKVDHMDGDRVKLTRKDEEHGREYDYHRYLPLGNISSLDQGKVWLSADAMNAQQLFEKEDGSPIDDDL